jgi:GNAT superfamily N-acetyltransferase
VGDQACRIERIRKDHERTAFSCGNADLDDFLRKYARQNDELGLARTFVAVRPGEEAVLGYHTLRSGEVAVEQFRPEETKRFPRYPVPVVHFARLAVDKRAQGQRLGESLLLDGLERALAVSRTVAAYAVEVVAIDESARAFYLKYGFQELMDDRRHLYLSMKTVEKLFGAG